MTRHNERSDRGTTTTTPRPDAAGVTATQRLFRDAEGGR